LLVEISLGHKEVPVTHLRKLMLEVISILYFGPPTII